jgi:plastocyanin
VAAVTTAPSRRSIALLILLSLVALGFVPAARGSTATPPPIVINELQTRGAGGAADEFVELYNPSTATVDIGGWLLRRSSSNHSVSTLAVVPAGTALAPDRSYVLGGTGYAGRRDLSYDASIADDGGIALARADGLVVDAVGLSSGSAFGEGRRAAAPPVGLSLQRQPDGADSGDNLADFAAAPPAPVVSSTARPNAVTMSDNAFKPAVATVTEGDRVYWRNSGKSAHTVTTDDGRVESGSVTPGATFAATFPTVGTFRYYCRFHGGPNGAGMAAQVVVLPRRGRLHPMTPRRVLDTRATGAPLRPGEVRVVGITGNGGVPVAGVSAVVANVAVTQPTSAGFISLYPAGELRSNASTLNFAAGATADNLVTAKLGSNGAIAVYNPSGTSYLIIDVVGYYDRSPVGSDGRFVSVAPARALDVAMTAGQTRRVVVTGRGRIPASGVTAALVNVTVTQPATAGTLLVWPAGTTRPQAASGAFMGGQNVSSRTVVAVPTSGADAGAVNVYVSAATHVAVDTSGWFTEQSTSGGPVAAVTPVRVFDTRLARPTVTAGATRVVPIVGQGGVPANASAVIVNLTVTNPSVAAALTATPNGGATSALPDVTYGPQQTVANLAVVRIGSDGAIALTTSAGGADVVVDLEGWVT